MNFVKHKNIPKVFEYSESMQYIKKNGQCYEVAAIVMEYVQNGDLFNYVFAGKRLSEDVVRTCFRSLIESKPFFLA